MQCVACQTMPVLTAQSQLVLAFLWGSFYVRPMDLAFVEAEALKLSEDDRAVLLDHLYGSLVDRQISHLPAHLAEARSRFADYQSGDQKALDAANVIKDIRTRLEP